MDKNSLNDKGNLTVALAGNPNSGKTTIFNNITGARQHAGNYPGVTVERREGFKNFAGKELLIIDLPGTYSLTAHSLDELVARNVVIDERPDVIVNILDASNLERNLYLAVQMLEMERPMVVCLNMLDVAEKIGEKVNDKLLAEKLGVAVVKSIGNKNEGTNDILEKVVVTTANQEIKPFKVFYGAEIEAKISEVITCLENVAGIKYPLRWLAIKLLENDQEIVSAIENKVEGKNVVRVVEKARIELKDKFSEEIELVLAEKRYAFANEIYTEVTEKHSHMDENFSDKIDNVLTHKIWGLPIFFGIMWLLFNFVFTVGAYPQEWIENGITILGDFVGQNMANGDLKSLVVDGIIGGVGAVLSFLPNILILFLGIALLEDTGYMARAAFVMDRVMRAVGLHGKSFIPLLVGFGCTIPSIMGTRTLENNKDRMVTMLVAPLMSCGARLPVYTLLIGAFFSEEIAGTMLFLVYFIGIMLAVLMAFIFRKTLFKGNTEPFIMEMPKYHLPTLRSIVTHMWERGVLYVKKAGTLILAATILIWFLTNYPTNVEFSKDYEGLISGAEEQFSQNVNTEVLAPLGLEKLEDNTELVTMVNNLKESTNSENTNAENLDSFVAENTALVGFAKKYVMLESEKDEKVSLLANEQAGESLAASYSGQIGRVIEPVIKPLGFDWKIGVGLVSGMAAKEVLVSTLGTIYSVGEADEESTPLAEAIKNDPIFSPLVAFSLMIFTLLYSPCFAALAVLKRETNSWKWTGFTFLYSTILAWIASFAIYQIGTLLGY